MKFFYIILVLLTFNLTQVFSQTVVTYAGTAQTPGNTMLSQLKDDAKFTKPYGIDMDSKGNIFIAETGNHTITVIAANGYTVIRAGGVGMASFVNATGTTSRFNSPHGLVVGLNDEIYICDYENHVIRMMTKFDNFGSNQVVSVFSGKYYVQGSYLKADPGYADGTATTAQFDGPSDIDIDASGNLYVADRNNHCIRKIATDGSVTTIAGVANSPGMKDGTATQAQFNTPTGIFVDGSDVYVADRGNSSIRKISGGQVTTVTDQLFLPNDVVKVGSDFYIADQCRIKKYSGGTVTTYAGSPSNNDCGFAEGEGTDAKFQEIMSLIALSNGDLLLSDYNNHILRKIMDCSSYSATITISGTSLTASSGDSYQWYKDSNPISGATKQTYDVSATGDYSCMVSYTDGCQAMSNSLHVEITTNAIEGTDFQQLNIFPNPAKNILNINLDMTSPDDIDLKIMNCLGQLIVSKHFKNVGSLNEQTNISGFDSGVYYLNIQSSKSVKTIRFIKE